MTRLAPPVTTGRDHIEGPSDALVTLVEYGDFECPHCGHAYPIVEEVRRRMGDRMRFVFRHFPLSQSHAHAEIAAEAAEAAGKQDRFWQMHGMLFTHQDALGVASLIGYAEMLELDTDLFKESLRERAFQAHVHEDFMSGVRSGVNGTPTFFINGERYNGMVSVPSLYHALDALAEVRQA